MMNDFEKINNRRHDLIDKMFEEGLSPKEEKELKRLRKQVAKELRLTLIEDEDVNSEGNMNEI